MSTRPSSPINSKRKIGSEDGSTSQRKKVRTQQEELVEAAKSFMDSLQPLQGNMQFPFLSILATGILGREPYGGSKLELLNIPIWQSHESPDQAIEIANERRAKLAELYRSALHTERVFHDRHKAIQHGIDALWPSESAKPSNLIAEQDEHPMKIGRPYGTTGPPISIYHPIFSKFRRLVGDARFTPSAEDAVAAFDLMEAAAEVYSDQTARAEHLRLCLDRLLARNFVGAPVHYKCRPDGVLFYEVPAGIVPLLVMETGNEIDPDGGDPSVQAAFSFRKLWVSSPATIRNVCCCPSFILSVAGSSITIHGGVLADDFIVQPLTEVLGLVNFPDPVERARYIAKIMVALRRCLKELEIFYNDLTPADEPQVACLSPTFQQYGDDKKVTITYTSGNLLSDSLGHAMLNAEAKQSDDERGTPVKVKFTPQYGHQAHALLAKENLAPQLRHYERLENGWAVVVMDSVAGRDLDSVGENAIPPRALKDIEDALKVLHEKNWVFGDLRRPNVMLCERAVPDGGTEQGAMLVDFDWAGEHGVQRYPPGLNQDIPWAKDVGRGGIMKKGHDLEMFGKLKSREV